MSTKRGKPDKLQNFISDGSGTLKEKLLQATEHFLTTSPQAAPPSLRSVARACGVSATAVYRHFSSQHDLIRSVLTTKFTGFEATILAADEATAPFRERVQRLSHAYMAWGVDNPGVYRLLFESADRLGEDYALGDATSVLLGRLVTLMKNSERTARTPEDSAERFWSYLHGLVSLRIHKPDHLWRHGAHDEVENLITLFFGPPR